MMISELASLLLVTLVILFAVFYAYRKFYAIRFFEREGIPGPPPHWLLGNIAAFANEEKRHLVHAQWTCQYGKLYGYFEGPRPTLVTSDVDLIHQVFVKRFQTFHAHKDVPFAPNPDKGANAVNMVTAKGERWKRLRSIVNPMFSAGKLRALTPLMQKCQADFMKLIDKKAASSNEAFDIFECFKFLTLDTISETAFGVELNSANTEGVDNPLLKTITAVLDDVLEIPFIMKLAIILPEFSPLFQMYEVFRGKFLASGVFRPRLKLNEMISKIITFRRQNHYDSEQESSIKRHDLLQMMMDLEDSAATSCDELLGPKFLTTAEIKAQVVLFMIAGFETSSTALAFTSFLLANNPHVQRKLLAEIDAFFSDPNKVADHDNVCELEYLECVINEALRMYPVAILVINRQAMEDTVVNGVHIPRGLPIQADVWSLHHDEDQWGPVDPNLFYPERFQKDYPTQPVRSSAAFLPFGLGPRMCIGARFSMLEMKLALVNLLRKYRIVKTPRTGDEVKLRVGFTISPKEGIWVKLVKRN